MLKRRKKVPLEFCLVSLIKVCFLHVSLGEPLNSFLNPVIGDIFVKWIVWFFLDSMSNNPSFYFSSSMVKKIMKICHCSLRRLAIRNFFILFKLISLQVAQNKKYFYMDIPPHLLIIMTYSNNKWQELKWNILISFETSILTHISYVS